MVALSISQMGLMFRRLLLSCLLTCCWVYADAPQWELNDPSKGWGDDDLVLEYFHHSEVQRQWAWELIGLESFQGDEKILDFGCGDGKITAQISHSLPRGEIVGVDLSRQMISFAGRSFPKKYYPSLSFLCSTNVDLLSTELKPHQKFDKIYSFFVFHLVPNPERVLRKLSHLIADTGQMVLVIPKGGNKPFFEAASRTFEEFDLVPPWKKNKTNESKATMRSLEGIRENIESAGWEITYFNEVHTPFAFVNRDQFIHWMLGTVTANWDIPKSLALEFFNRLVTHMVDIDPSIMDENGVCSFKLARVHVRARLPL